MLHTTLWDLFMYAMSRGGMRLGTAMSAQYMGVGTGTGTGYIFQVKVRNPRRHCTARAYRAGRIVSYHKTLTTSACKTGRDRDMAPAAKGL